MNKSLPIIVGILSIIIGVVLTITSKSYLFIILVLAGLILLIPVKNHAKKFKLFLKSFKFDKKVWLILLLEAFYWIVFFLLLKGAQNLIETKTKALTLAQFAAGTMESFVAVKQVLYFILLVIIMLILLILIFYTLSRYPIWALLLRKKFNRKSFLKFFLLNLLWWLLWIPLAFILITGLKGTLIKNVTIMLIVLYIFMTTKLHYTMLKTNSIKKSYANGIGFLTLIPKFLQPAACAALVYFILLGILWVVSKFITTPGILLHAILFILFIVWLRYYLKSYIEDFKM